MGIMKVNEAFYMLYKIKFYAHNVTLVQVYTQQQYPRFLKEVGGLN